MSAALAHHSNADRALHRPACALGVSQREGRGPGQLGPGRRRLRLRRPPARPRCPRPVRDPARRPAREGSRLPTPRLCCGESQDWAGPDCFPPDKKVDPLTRLPVEPSWFLEPLKWIQDAGPMPVSTHERRRRASEATFLIEQLEAHIDECSHDPRTYQPPGRVAELRHRPPRAPHPRQALCIRRWRPPGRVRLQVDQQACRTRQGHRSLAKTESPGAQRAPHFGRNADRQRSAVPAWAGLPSCEGSRHGRLSSPWLKDWKSCYRLIT